MFNSKMTIKYFSMFSGAGGFEIGINNAWRNTNTGKEKNQQHPKGDQSVFEESQRKQNSKSNKQSFEDTKNSDRALFQNRQEQSNSNSSSMDSIKGSAEFSGNLRQASHRMETIRANLSDDKEVIFNKGSKSEFDWGKQPVCVGYSEINPYSLATYKKHFGGHKNYGDATKIIPKQLPDFNFLVGGFPCQSFSIAGKRRGFKDTRGTLFFDIARILKAKQPRMVLLENVKGLLSSKTFITFDIFLRLIYYEVKGIWQINNYKTIKEMEMITDNLSNYLQSIGGINGLKKKLKYLVIQLLQTIKKPNNLMEEQMRQFADKEEDWGLNLNLLFSIENLNQMDIGLLEKTMDINDNLVLLLKKCSEEISSVMKLFITSMETKETIEKKTCLSAVRELNILIFIIKHWKLSNNLWKKILSSSTKTKGGIYYVKTFNIILNTLNEVGYDAEWQVLNSKHFGVPQNRERVFIIGHLRGASTRQVFPISGNDSEIANEIRYVKKDWQQHARIYDTKGISPTLAGASKVSGDCTPKIAIYDDENKSWLKSNICGTIQAHSQSRSGFKIAIQRLMLRDGRDNRSCLRSGRVTEIGFKGKSIRRLTPVECERLQGFPDNWTKKGYIPIKEDKLERDIKKGNVTKEYAISEISDTQRYKLCGNAVTVNVIEAIMRKIAFS